MNKNAGSDTRTRPHLHIPPWRSPYPTLFGSRVYFVNELVFQLQSAGAHQVHVIFEIQWVQLLLDSVEVSSGCSHAFCSFSRLHAPIVIMAKATKQTKKFVSSGKLKQTIEKRRKYQQVKKKVAGREIRKAAKEKNGKGKHADETSDEEYDEDLMVESDDDAGSKKNKGKG